MSQVKCVELPTGIQMEYEDWGEGHRPLVLVHGFTGSRDDWRERLPELVVEGRTIAIDQRGHGGSTNTGDQDTYTLEQLVLDLEAFDHALGLGPMDLLGHSLGGMVALRFALRHPERVASLILMDTSPYGLELAPRRLLEGGTRFARVAGMIGLAQVMRETERRNPQMPASTRRLVTELGEEYWWKRTCAKLEKMDPEAFAGLGCALSEQAPVTDQLGSLRCPTTVIVGAEDVNFIAPSEKMAGAIPDARLVTLQNAAHNGQLEDPEAWMKTLREHLAHARA